MGGLIQEMPEKLKSFANKFLNNEVENFVDMSRFEKRTDTDYGLTRIFVEVCMNENYQDHECDQFKIFYSVQKLLNLYGEESFALEVSVIKSEKVFIDKNIHGKEIKKTCSYEE